jgi:hypothetical protein
METDLSTENTSKPRFVDRVITMTILGAGMGFGVMCLMCVAAAKSKLAADQMPGADSHNAPAKP